MNPESVNNTQISTNMQEVSDISVYETLKSTTQQTTVADTLNHTLYDLLERPTLILSSSWQSTENAITEVVTQAFVENPPPPFVALDFPQAILDANPVVSDKLANFQFLKSDLEIEIKTNATPFQQGALLIIYNPYGSSVGTWRETTVRHAQSLTSFPHAIINLQSGTSALMKLPYANLFDMFDLSDIDDQFGRIEIYPLVAITAAVMPTSCDLQVYARFVNPEVRTATNSGLPLNAKRLMTIMSDSKNSAVVDQFYTKNWKPQMDSVKNTVKSAMSYITGVSKPLITSASTAVLNLPGRFMGNSDGVDQSTNLSLCSKNAVNVKSIVPENVDEMDLKFILSRPNVFYRWSSNSQTFVRSARLFSYDNQVVKPPMADLFTLGSFSYACMLARYWRGALKYKLTMVKTSYHAGRIAIVYIPTGDVPDSLGNLLSTNYNIIVDLATEDCEVEFEVPYMSHEAWKKTKNNSGSATESGSNGSIGIYAVSDLRYPDTVSDKVDFFIEISAGDDFELAKPTTQMSDGAAFAVPPQVKHWEPQIAMCLVPDNQRHNSNDVVASTMGEKFSSLRGYMKRFARTMQVSTDVWVSYQPIFKSNDGNEGIGYYGVNTIVAKNSPTETIQIKPSTPLSLVSNLFRFYGGATKVKIAMTNFNQSIIYGLRDGSANRALDLAPTSGPEPINAIFCNVNNMLEANLPYYSTIKARVFGRSAAVENNINITFKCENVTDSPVDVYEAAGDDLNMFFLIGPPVMSVDIDSRQIVVVDNL